MKKLIVFSVIFALVAGSVFAADISAAVFGSANLLSGSDKQEVKDKKDDADGTYVYVNKDMNGTSFGIGRVRLEASGALEDGSIGGSLRYDAGGSANGWVWWKPVDAFKLQIGTNPDGEFGLDGVTRWGFYQMAGEVIISAGNAWGGTLLKQLNFEKPVKDDGKPNYEDVLTFSDAFFGGWGGGLLLTAAPVDALAINIGIPLDGTAYKQYLKFTAQVKYNIDGVGTAGITYANGLGHEDGGTYYAKETPGSSGSGTWTPGGTDVFDKDGNKIGTTGGTWSDPAVPGKPGYKGYNGDANDPSQMWIYFGLSSIENLGIDVGVGLKFPSDVTSEKKYYGNGKVESEETLTRNYPLNVGLGANFSSGALGVKARIIGQFLGSRTFDTVAYDAAGSKITTGNKTENYTLGDGWAMLIDVQPSFAVNEKLTAYLSMGVGFKTGWDERDPVLDSNGNQKVDGGNGVFEIKADPRADFAWHVQPYVSITPSYWSGTFFAGFRLESSSVREEAYVSQKEKTKVLAAKEQGTVPYARVLNWSIPIGITMSF